MDDPFSAFKCESITIIDVGCNYTCHRNCRAQMRVSCAKITENNGDADGSTEVSKKLNYKHASERIRLIAEKLAALQKEVDIEMKIQQGLEKIIKAKGISNIKKKKNLPADAEVLTQLEKSTNRLDFLKHEMQKRRIQLQTLQDKHDAAFEEMLEVPFKRGTRLRKGNSVGDINMMNSQDLGKGTDSELQDDRDGGLIRVLAEDEFTKTQSKKAIFISHNQSTVEVIATILQKMNIPGIPSNYSLGYINAEQSNLFLN